MHGTENFNKSFEIFSSSKILFSFTNFIIPPIFIFSKNKKLP